MIRAVADTGPLLHLTEAQTLHLLELIGDLHTPAQVIAEMAYHMPVWQAPSWLTIRTLTAAHAAEASAWLQAELLHAGEAAAIALARQIDAAWLLTDDTGARLFAVGLGLEVHGSLGVILWAAAAGHLDHAAAHQCLLRLASSSLWISRKIFLEAQAAIDEIFG